VSSKDDKKKEIVRAHSFIRGVLKNDRVEWLERRIGGNMGRSLSLVSRSTRRRYRGQRRFKQAKKPLRRGSGTLGKTLFGKMEPKKNSALRMVGYLWEAGE